jgi:hypothetical protein
MDNIIFFHVCTIGRYFEVLEEMLNSIYESGILDKVKEINMCVLGGGILPKISCDKIKVLDACDDINRYEFFTLRHIQEEVKRNKECNILYIHTKGVSVEKNDCIEDWRKYMEYFLINNFEECVDFLKTHDAVGVDWRGSPSPHFSGTFWWATARYLSTLPEIDEISSCNSKKVLTLRHNAEFWIGMNKAVKVKCLWDCGIDQFERHLHRYKIEEYIKEK